MTTFTVLPVLVALLVGLGGLQALNIYQVNARGLGIIRFDPYRKRSWRKVRNAISSLRLSLMALWRSPGARLAGAAAIALLVAHLSNGPELAGMVLLGTVAPSVSLQEMRNKRAALLADAASLKGADGGFKDDATRASFDVKMTELEGLDAQIRALDPTAPAGPAAVDAVAAVAAEKARITGIQAAVRTAKLPDAFGADLVARNVTLDAARAAIFEKLSADQAATDPVRTISMGEDNRDKWIRGATNWLLVKSGEVRTIAKHEKQDVAAYDAGEFRGMSLLDLAKDALTRAGRPMRGMDKMRIVSEAFTLRATHSTSDFATLLENVMHKMLQASYGITPDTWSRFCATGTVSDFRAHNRYRHGNFGTLDTVAENGEFKHKSIADGEKESLTATTKGNIVNVSRQMIINDDMGVFTQLLAKLGRAAKLTVEVDVYALLALNSGDGPTMSDSVALFHTSSHGANKTTGAAITAASLDLDRVAMASQRDPNSNEYLDLRPAILVLPTSLGGQARILNTSQYDPDTVANKSQMKPNIVNGLFRDIVDTPRISSTRRYLFADPSIAPVIEVAFLEGQSEPVLETRDGWNTDGTEMKVRHDYAVGAVDWRGAVTNAGQ